MPSEKITFTGALGEELSARLDLPHEGEPKAFILFAHCFTCGKDLSAITRIARELNSLGYGLFRFDFTGLGLSDGDFANTNFSSNVQDLIKAADYLREHYEAPKVLVGHSLGGTAVLAAAHKIPEAVAVATIGAPCDSEHVLHNFKDALGQIEIDGKAEVDLVGRSFTIQKQFVDDAKAQSMQKHIANLGRALLLFHSPTDETVSIDNARMIYDAAKHPKSFVTLDGADHLLMKRAKDGRFVARMLAAYVERYIEAD